MFTYMYICIYIYIYIYIERERDRVMTITAISSAKKRHGKKGPCGPPSFEWREKLGLAGPSRRAKQYNIIQYNVL